MKNNIKVIFSFLLATCLSSCSLVDNIIDSILKNNTSNNSSYNSNQEHEDVGASIELLNKAFNGKREGLTPIEYSIEEGEGYEIYEIPSTPCSLEYFEGNPPSTGKIKGLVIPVDFPDYIIGNSIKEEDVIDPEWESVSSFYYKSSYGKLDLTFDVLDWYTTNQKASYYANMKSRIDDAPGVSAIIEEALSYYEDKINLKDYDSNDDGIIDALYIIYNHPIDYVNSDFWWAFQYYTMKEKKHDEVQAYPYIFASIDFLFEQSEDSYVTYPVEEYKVNTHTYIHETAHLFGIEDYYDSDSTSGKKSGGFGGADLMDCTIGDHNSFTKISLGWIDKVILITGECTIDLKALQDAPIAILFANSFDKEKGMFQSYYLLEYYTPTKLQEFDKIYKTEGVRMLRVNAELSTYTSGTYSYQYYKYNNYDTGKDLLDVVLVNGKEYSNSRSLNEGLKDSSTCLFTTNMTSPKAIYENGIARSNYTQFEILELGKTAKISFRKTK